MHDVSLLSWWHRNGEDNSNPWWCLHSSSWLIRVEIVFPKIPNTASCEPLQRKLTIPAKAITLGLSHVSWQRQYSISQGEDLSWWRHKIQCHVHWGKRTPVSHGQGQSWNGCSLFRQVALPVRGLMMESYNLWKSWGSALFGALSMPESHSLQSKKSQRCEVSVQ